MRPGHQGCGEFLRLTLGLSVASRTAAAAGSDAGVKLVVAYPVGDTPPEPAPVESAPDAYGAINDDLLQPAPEREGDDLDAQCGRQALQVHGHGEIVALPETQGDCGCARQYQVIRQLVRGVRLSREG